MRLTKKQADHLLAVMSKSQKRGGTNTRIQNCLRDKGLVEFAAGDRDDICVVTKLGAAEGKKILDARILARRAEEEGL